MNTQQSRRDRLGTTKLNVFRDVRLSGQTRVFGDAGLGMGASASGSADPGKGSTGASASGSAGPGKGGSASGGAAVWKPKMRGEVPEEEMRKRFLAFTAEERAQFSDVLVIRTPCCYSARPAGGCQCMFCGALLQYKGNIIPSAPGSVNAMAGGTVTARAALAAKIVHVGRAFHMRSKKGDFWQHIANALRWRSKWKLQDLPKKQSYADNGWCPWIAGPGRVRPWAVLNHDSEPPYSGSI